MKRLISVLLSLLLLPLSLTAQQIGKNSPSISLESADTGGNVALITHGTAGSVNIYTSDTLRASITDGGFISSSSYGFLPGAFESVAAGTSIQGDGPLSATKYLHFVTGFDETKVVTLPACATADIGKVHTILNAVTNKFSKIFPALGGTINSLSANAAYTQGVAGQGGKTLVCFCQAANQWFCA